MDYFACKRILLKFVRHTARAAVAVACLSLLLGRVAQAAERGRVETIQFHSMLIGKTLPYSVLLPVGYDPSASTRYPVIYFLHGFGGHYDNCLKGSHIIDYAAKYPMIIVMPEGGEGWYTDSSSVPADKYESYFFQELIPDVDARYKTINARRARAVMGNSMGGYGAIKFAVQRPDLFAFAASMSGALNITDYTAPPPPGELHHLGVMVNQTFGPNSSQTRLDNDTFALYKAVPDDKIAGLPYLYLDCGTEDFLIDTNRAMDALLISRHIPHEFRDRPGMHDWTEWDAQLPGILQLAAEKMHVSPQ